MLTCDYIILSTKEMSKYYGMNTQIRVFSPGSQQKFWRGKTWDDCLPTIGGGIALTRYIPEEKRQVHQYVRPDQMLMVRVTNDLIWCLQRTDYTLLHKGADARSRIICPAYWKE